MARASPSSRRQTKGTTTRRSLTRAGARRMERGLARTLSTKERANTARDPLYTVMEETDWNQWSGDVEQEGDGALALFNTTDGLAGRRSNTFIPSGQPMRVNLGDFIKQKKVFTSKSGDKKDNSKKFQQNRFEILGCLLQDVKVSEEEQQDGGALRKSPDTMLPPTPPLRTNTRDSKLHSLNFGHKSTASEKCKGATGKRMMRKVAECNSKSFESDIDEIHEKELCGLFEADNTLCHLNDRWVKIEAVVDSGTAESVALADMAPWVPMLASSGSKRGQTYMSACGEKLPNLGQKQLKVWTNEGKLVVAMFQCADVTRNLCSVSKICDQGNRVVFEGQGGFIESPNGARTSFKRENNVYVLKVHAKEPGDQRSDFAWPSK